MPGTYPRFLTKSFFLPYLPLLFQNCLLLSRNFILFHGYYAVLYLCESFELSKIISLNCIFIFIYFNFFILSSCIYLNLKVLMSFSDGFIMSISSGISSSIFVDVSFLVLDFLMSLESCV